MQARATSDITTIKFRPMASCCLAHILLSTLRPQEQTQKIAVQDQGQGRSLRNKQPDSSHWDWGTKQTEQGRNPVTSRKTKSKRVNTSRQTKFAGSFYCVMETGLPHLLHEDRNRTGTEARAGIAAVEKNGGRAWAHRSMVTEQAAWLRWWISLR
jgi:hypothetical protein